MLWLLCTGRACLAPFELLALPPLLSAYLTQRFGLTSRTAAAYGVLYPAAACVAAAGGALLFRRRSIDPHKHILVFGACLALSVASLGGVVAATTAGVATASFTAATFGVAASQHVASLDTYLLSAAREQLRCRLYATVDAVCHAAVGALLMTFAISSRGRGRGAGWVLFRTLQALVVAAAGSLGLFLALESRMSDRMDRARREAMRKLLDPTCKHAFSCLI
jgi:hypothetical protein